MKRLTHSKLMFVFLLGILVPGLMFAGGQKESSAPAKDGEPVEVNWYVQIPPSFDPAIDEAIALFEQKNPGIKVNYEHLNEGDGEEFLQKVDLLLLAGDDTEVISYTTNADVIDRGRKGMLEPLNQYFEAEGAEYSDIYSIKMDDDGTYYGLPTAVKIWYVMLNKDHLNEAGLPLPPDDWTLQEYREYAQKLTKGTGNSKRYGAYLHNWPMFNYIGMWSAKQDNPLFYENGEPTLDHKAFKGFMQYRKQLEADGYEMPFVDAKAGNVHYLGAFFNERFSMQIIGSWTINATKKLDKFPHDFVTAFAPLPRFDENQPAERTFSENSSYAINANGKNKEAAYKFIRFITTEGQPIIAEGFSPQKGADNKQILEKMMGDYQHLYDVESLVNTINGRVDNVTTYFAENQDAYEDILASEMDLYLADPDYTYEEMEASVLKTAEGLLQ
jgi:multiple sugar transport system substrate-binding protein